jgi:hypothetical protein
MFICPYFFQQPDPSLNRLRVIAPPPSPSQSSLADHDTDGREYRRASRRAELVLWYRSSLLSLCDFPFCLVVPYLFHPGSIKDLLCPFLALLRVSICSWYHQAYPLALLYKVFHGWHPFSITDLTEPIFHLCFVLARVCATADLIC